MSFNINNKAKAKVGVGILASSLALALLLPVSAFAATIEVTQKGKDGGTSPSSTIVVKKDDKNGEIVKEVPYPGGNEVVKITDLAEGTYYVTGRADGYTFNSQGGPITDAVGGTVELTATPTEKVVGDGTITVTVKDGNGNPLSNVTVTVYSGSSITGEQVNSEKTGDGGNKAFEKIVADGSSYTIALSNIPAGYKAPAPKTVTLTADQKTASVDFVLSPDTTASNTQTNNTTGNTANKAAGNTSNTTADDTALSQTGDASMAILGIGAATAALAALATWAFSKRRRR